jgi:hypothetical protein
MGTYSDPLGTTEDIEELLQLLLSMHTKRSTEKVPHC